MSPNVDYLSLAGLRARGWTVGLVTQLLQEPDAFQCNPHYASAPPMRLYLSARVEACEQQPDWEARCAPIRQRQATAAKAVATKRAQVAAYLDALLVVVPRWPDDELVERACNHYNQRQSLRATWYAKRHAGSWDGVCWAPATPVSAPAFLARAAVNYLRHECSIYELELFHLAGKVGAGEAMRRLHAQVCEAIAAAYPQLAEECTRQVAAKRGEETV